MKLRLNIKELVELSVCGEVVSARWSASRTYRVGYDGRPRVLPSTGGICYSHFIGDSALHLRGDHVEPGVSIRHGDRDTNAALNLFSCVGNQARVLSGQAKGAAGTVCGTHGGVDHVIIDFPRPAIERLAIGVRIQIRSHGVGLELIDFPQVTVMNCDPNLLLQMGIKPSAAALEVPVTHIVPAKIMGSGLGHDSCYEGDYDIQMFDQAVVQEYNLDSLRFGDLVAISDADHTYGRHYCSGAVSVGVVVHSRSDVSGHGPGVTTLFTSREGCIRPKLDRNANIGFYLKLGTWRKGGRRGSSR